MTDRRKSSGTELRKSSVTELGKSYGTEPASSTLPSRRRESSQMELGGLLSRRRESNAGSESTSQLSLRREGSGTELPIQQFRRRESSSVTDLGSFSNRSEGSGLSSWWSKPPSASTLIRCSFCIHILSVNRTLILLCTLELVLEYQLELGPV